MPEFLSWYSKTGEFVDLCRAASEGTTNRVRLKEDRFLATMIPLPPLPEQQRLVAKLATLTTRIDEVTKLRYQTNLESKTLLAAMLGQEFQQLAIKHEPKPLGSLATCITDGPHITPTYVTDGVPFVTVKNMVSGTLDFRNLQYITDQDHLEISKRCKPERGDVLYSKDGATRQGQRQLTC